jgi:hypothetical protein
MLPHKEFIKIYTPDSIGFVGSDFYDSGWYQFKKLTKGDKVLYILDLDGFRTFYNKNDIPSMNFKSVCGGNMVRWWSIKEIRENNLNNLFIN